MQIFEPTFSIILNQFFEQFDAKQSTWRAMVVKQHRNVSSSGNAGKTNRSISKQNRGRQDGFFQQSGASGFSFFYLQYWPPSGYTSYQFQNPAYQN